MSARRLLETGSDARCFAHTILALVVLGGRGPKPTAGRRLVRG